jgi:hypothetical protein
MTISATSIGQRVVIQVSDTFLFTVPRAANNGHDDESLSEELILHYRLGHISDRKMAYMASQESYQKHELVIRNPNDRVRTQQFCDCCNMVKAHKIRSTKEVIRKLSLLGQDWHADLIGKQRH